MRVNGESEGVTLPMLPSYYSPFLRLREAGGVGGEIRKKSLSLHTHMYTHASFVNLDGITVAYQHHF